jgi:hypothetical protein
LNSLNIKDKGACFHSFRDAMREAQIPRELSAALGGWKISEDVMDEYGNGYRLTSLNKAMQQIKLNGEFKTLNLTKQNLKFDLLNNLCLALLL